MQELPHRKNPRLDGDEALMKWRGGPESWNNWIRENPAHDIRFDGVDFSSEREAGEAVSFAGYDFGNGNVSFIGAKFGDGDVSFDNAQFGDGNFDFMEAIFGTGNVSFSNAVFGTGAVNFFKTKFGNGDVNFIEVTFGDGNVSFFETEFGEGKVEFLRSVFGKGYVDFRKSKFAGPIVSFSVVDFGEGIIDFQNTSFTHGLVRFYRSTFRKGDVSFIQSECSKSSLDFNEAIFENSRAIFFKAKLRDFDFARVSAEQSEVLFTHATFGKGRVNLDGSKFLQLSFEPKRFDSSDFSAQDISISRSAVFAFSSALDNLKSCQFSGASFEGPLSLSGKLGVIPDFRRTKSSHQFELSDLEATLRRKPKPKNWLTKWSTVAIDAEDASRLRRLKEIAETNKDHQAALRFSADENRARRWLERSRSASLLDIAFSGLSNYGQSILRPSFWLAGFFVIGTSLYKVMGAKEHPIGKPEWWGDLGQAIALATSNSLPFLPQSRGIRDDAIKALYSNAPSLWVDAIMIGQGALSFIFLFLIGLGLRNRFRL